MSELIFTAAQLIKMGKFKEAIPSFANEMTMAIRNKVITERELVTLWEEFSHILLNPSDFDRVQTLGNQILMLEMRIPGLLRTVTKEEYYNNIKLNYETTDTNDQ